MYSSEIACPTNLECGFGSSGKGRSCPVDYSRLKGAPPMFAAGRRRGTMVGFCEEMIRCCQATENSTIGSSPFANSAVATAPPCCPVAPVTRMSLDCVAISHLRYVHANHDVRRVRFWLNSFVRLKDGLLQSESIVFGPAERIRQTPSQIEPMQAF